MPTVVCHGESNTHGADPVALAQCQADVRWPGGLDAQPAGVADVIEEGLDGRMAARRLGNRSAQGRRPVATGVPRRPCHAAPAG